MRRLLLLLPLFIAWGNLYSQPFRSYTPSSGINIKFYKNAEFLGFAFFLGSQYMGELYENDETLTKHGIKKKDWFAYDLALYKEYKSFKGNKNLATVTRFAESIDGSTLLHLLLQLRDFPNAALPKEISPLTYLPFSEKRDTAEARKNVLSFIEALNQFYRDVNFDKYFIQKDHLYKQAITEIKSKLPGGKFLKAMEKFYRGHFDAYTLLPSLTTPSGMAFAIRFEQKGSIEIINAFGPFALQQFDGKSRINMGFANEKHLRELSTHEFGHSFTNPVLDKLPRNLIRETAILFDTIKTAMEDQGYNNWQTCLYEHFVRAGEVVIARILGNHKDAEQLQSDYITNRKFIYLPVIIKELEKYYKDTSDTYQQAAIRVMESLKSAVH